jgi:hypothetical protein
MIRVFLFLVAFVLVAKHSWAQSSFAQVNQLPLQMNPSLSGGKEKKRLSLGWNTLQTDQKQESNYAFGYDQVVRKLGSGIGVYYSFHDQKNDKLGENWKPLVPNDISGLNYLASYQQHLAGICIAPKFNIMSRNNPTKIRYTFSPSLFVEMGKENRSTINQFHTQNFNSTLYSVDYTDGIALFDSSVTDYVRYKTDLNLFRSGIGLQLNSGNLIVLAKIAFERSASNETIGFQYYNQLTYFQKEYNSQAKHILYALEPNLHLSYSFSKIEDAKFVFTPIVGIGMKHYLSLGTKPDSSASNAVYSLNLTSRPQTEINYKHASANFRYSKLLFGVAFTQFRNTTYLGGSLGFQNKWMKLIGNFNSGIGGIDKPKLFNEITLGLFL